MFRFIKGLFALIGLITVLLAAGGGYLAYRALEREEPVPETIVLELDLDQPLAEYVPDDPLAGALFARTESLRDMVDALDRARSDPRVKGVVARLGGDRIGTGKIQEPAPRSSGSATADASRTRSPRRSANWGRATARTTWRAGSTGSGFSRSAWSG